MIVRRVVPRFVLAGALVGLLAAPAAADYTDVPGSGVMIDGPKGWVVETSGDNTLLLTPHDQTVSVMAVADSTSKSVNDSLQAMEKLVKVGVPDAAPIGPMPGTLGAFDGFVATTKGTAEGTKMLVTIGAFKAPTGFVGVLTFGQVGKFEKKHKATLKALLASIAPVPERAFDPTDNAVKELPPGGAAFAEQVAVAVGRNDGSAFVAMVPDVFLQGKTKVKRAKVATTIAKKDGLRKFLKQDAESPWQIEPVDGSTFAIYRGSGYGKVTMIRISNGGGQWQVTGTFPKNLGAP